jgi:hypothetical protein
LYTGGSKIRILQQPTTDPAKVQAAIENIPTTVNSQGAGATGELPLPDSARQNTPIFDWQFAQLRRLAKLPVFSRKQRGQHQHAQAISPTIRVRQKAGLRLSVPLAGLLVLTVFIRLGSFYRMSLLRRREPG